MSARALFPLVLLSAALALAPPAGASVDQEARRGQAIIEQLQTGKTNCDTLAAADFEQVGEFVIGRMTGSLRLHEAMNARMRTVLGAGNEQRMHELMGRRYAGCAFTGRPDDGPGDDGRAWLVGHEHVGPMMDTGDWAWMRDGNWQHMSHADWERVSDPWPAMLRTTTRGGWSTATVLAAAFGALVLLGGISGVIAFRRRSRRGAAV